MLATFNKDEKIFEVPRIQMPLSGLPIEVLSQPETRYGDVVWGVYEMSVEISRLYSLRTRVPSLSADVFVGSIFKGRIRMGQPNSAVGLPAVVGKAEHNSTISRRTSIASRRADTGDVVSINDHDLMISYQFRGYPLDAGQVLTLFLKSMIICSEHDDGETDVNFIVSSADQQFKLHMQRVEPSQGDDQFSWERVRFALRVHWMIIV